MSRGYRSIIVAAVVWLILAADAPQPAPPNPGPDARVGDALTNISAGLERREKDEARSPERRPCQGVAQDRDSDLCAQWTAANAAKKSSDWADLTGWLSVGSFVLSVFSLGALIYTLSQTNKTLRLAQKERATATLRALAADRDTKAALDIAEKNAMASTEQVKISQQSSQRQLRAYLDFHSIKVEGFTVGGKAKIIAVVKNSGKTPAYNAITTIYPFLGSAPPEFAKVKFAESRHPPSNGGLPAGSEGIYDIWPEVPLTKADINSIIAGGTVFIVAGIVTYKDTFGKIRRSTMKCFLDPRDLDENGNAGFGRCARGNRSS